MSSSIWTLCAGDSELHLLRLTPWRVVEAQHQVSTRKLVDSAEEQELLEVLIDAVKPADVTAGRLHYLLSTPFRYPPLPHGSRFGQRSDRGIWYGSETREAAFAEVAYYRLLFLKGTSAPIHALSTALTAFHTTATSSYGLDLLAPPFSDYRDPIASPESYSASQALGHDMRAAKVELFRFPSARSKDGINVGAFSPSVFGKGKPRGFETWHCTATRELVEFGKRDYLRRKTIAFERTQFLVDGELPAPAI